MINKNLSYAINEGRAAIRLYIIDKESSKLLKRIVRRPERTVWIHTENSFSVGINQLKPGKTWRSKNNVRFISRGEFFGYIKEWGV